MCTDKGKDQERELLHKLISRGVLEVRPSLNNSGVHYAEAEDTLKNMDPGRIKQILEDLEKKGALQSKVVERILICPNCGSPDVHSKYTCPKCNSVDVEYNEIIEHMKCGHIGSRSDFTKDSKLVCPSCQTELNDETPQYRIIGTFYQCEKCGNHFDKPETIHVCQQCGKLSTYQETKYIKILSYQITDSTIKGFDRDLPILDDIKEILTQKGFSVKLHTKILGASGAESSFDVFAEKNRIRLAVDVSLSGNKNDIISLLAKKVDVKPSETLIIDLSSLDELSSLGKVFGITVLKTVGDENFSNLFQSFLETLDRTQTLIEDDRAHIRNRR